MTSFQIPEGAVEALGKHELRDLARDLWRKHGGGQHGPHTETMTIPLHDNFHQFCEALATAALRAATPFIIAACAKRIVDLGAEWDINRRAYAASFADALKMEGV